MPMPSASKAPKHKRWQEPDRAFSDAKVARVFFEKYPTSNVGLLHSASGTCAIDIDHIENTRIIFEALGIDFDALMQSAPQIKGRPDRGKLIFRAPSHLTRRSIAWPTIDNPRKTEIVFELRAGPVQDVLPPSIHPDTGRPYRWEGPSIWDGIPELPPQLLALWEEWDKFYPQMKSMCPWLAEPEFQPQPKERPKSDGPSVIDACNDAHDIHSLLAHYGYIRTGKNWYLSPRSTTKLAGVNVFDDGRAFSHHGSDPFDNEHSFDCFELFCQYEHSGKVKSAVKAAAERLDMNKPRLVHAVSKNPEETHKPLFKRIGVEDVVPPVWLVKSHIEEGTFVMVFGPSGAKKSFLVYDLACCIATGKDWHGHRV